MPSITLKNIPEPVYLALKQRAAANRRSMNSEAIRCLELAALHPPGETREDILARIVQRRESLKLPFLEDRDLRAMREEGRS